MIANGCSYCEIVVPLADLLEDIRSQLDGLDDGSTLTRCSQQLSRVIDALRR